MQRGAVSVQRISGTGTYTLLGQGLFTLLALTQGREERRALPRVTP